MTRRMLRLCMNIVERQKILDAITKDNLPGDYKGDFT